MAKQRPRPFVTPPEADPRRHAVERRTALWLAYLGKLPKWAVAIVFAVVFLIGAIYPGIVGAAALLLVVVALLVLAFVTWPSVTGGARVVRVFVILALLAWAVAKLVVSLNNAS